MDLNKQIQFQKKSFGTIAENIEIALGNSRSATDIELLRKNAILEKLPKAESFTSEEIVQIKQNCREILVDFATLAVIREIAPQDLKT